jgi:DNA polymerase-3 subunit alpha
MHNFTHLQVHSHYTLLGGTASVDDLIQRATADGLTHLALTDTNALYGVVAFDEACRAAGIQPILGMTVTVATSQDEIAPDEGAPGRLVLLATGPSGYRSLCRLSSLIQSNPDRETSATQGQSWEALKAHREGLICLSGGRMCWVERHIRSGNLSAAHRYAGRLAGIYGENTYLSLELHRPEDRSIAQESVGIAQRLGLPSVAVQPVYCLSPQDAPRLRLLTAIDHNCPLDVVPASALPASGDPDVNLHWLSPDEVAARFAGFPQALAAVAEITSRCEPALPDPRPVWPALKLPEGQTTDEALANLARAGLADHFGPRPSPVVGERLQRELTAIARRGYAPLFLVVADVVRFARQAEIPVSTRGSVANSLVAYCLGITTVDPIAHDLIFERFLNPARADPSSYASGQDIPDIDLDFCSRRRDEVLDYVRRTYGADRVALVATVSTMRPRSALRETAKAYRLDEREIKRLVAGLPPGWVSTRRRDKSITLDDVLTGVDDARLRQVVRAANDLIGQPHHLSVHPGGVVITPGPLTDWLPVQWAPKGFLMTQFDHRDLEALGLPKLDLLGIRALTVLADAAELVRRHYDPSFRLAGIPLDDPATGDLLAQGDTIGVFQCESSGARRTLRQLQARTVRDLTVANAFFKPGPATGGMAQTFIRRYRGKEQVAFLHPALAPILDTTQGVLLFQEQILRVATEIAGLNWEQANHLRRGMSKMDPVEMAQMETQFVAGCQRPSPKGPGFTPEQAQTLWEQVVAFAGYGFNQGHATAYADVGYRSAYLKAHWPAAFLCARLADRGGFHHPAIYIAEALRLGIVVRPPHVNCSGRAFKLDVASEGKESPVLWMGLGQVRDLRRASVRAIVMERRRGPFADLRDLLRRVSLQAKEVAHLIQCGALDGLGESRAALLAEAEKIQRAGSARQMTFAFAQPAVSPESPEQRLAWERHVLGQPISVFPLELVAHRLPDHVPLHRLPELPGRPVTVAGVRLPGWTGGRGFFLGDGESFVLVKGSEPSPPSWQPLLLRGRWLGDEWSTFWFQAEAVESAPAGRDS